MTRRIELLWDDWNEEHVAHHGVVPEEAMEVARNAPQLTHVRDDLYRLVGQTDGGRFLTVYIAPRGGGDFYVVIARPATSNERRLYRRR
ncbi:MAG: BrnT family toxin [Chloroflexota bacterium]|nr:BrnT family toxin [Chloroflexota bacterium]